MASLHLRSISLPTRSHPLAVRVEDQIYKLKTSQSSSIGQKLAGLKELCECFNDFLQLSLTQQTLLHERLNHSVEEALNGSLCLLDICSTTGDFLLRMKESVQGLEISLRRARCGESRLDAVDSYMASRKKLNKVICKYLRNLKKQGKICKTTTLVVKNSHLADITVMLKGVQETGVAVFESVLSFISLPGAKSKLSVLSNLWQSKHASCESAFKANDMEKIDAELLMLMSNNINQVHNMLKGLETLELSFQEAAEESEWVYRQLVKSRVSLLNILNH